VNKKRTANNNMGEFICTTWCAQQFVKNNTEKKSWEINLSRGF